MELSKAAARVGWLAGSRMRQTNAFPGLSQGRPACGPFTNKPRRDYTRRGFWPFSSRSERSFSRAIP